MAVHQDQVPIQRPCPVDLPESFRAGARERHCDHCNKRVHLLSSLTEREAQAFLAAAADQDVCVTYLVGADGRIAFQPEPTIVPVSSLSRRRASAVAVASLGVALAACAPHERPRIDDVEPALTQSVGPRIPDAAEPTTDEPCAGEKPTVVPEHTMMAGGLIAEPPPVPEPPPPDVRPRMFAGAPRIVPPPQTKRGAMKRID
ncbi:MAG: hypothetical protein IPK74_07840 [Deltaproteobacteria bacterium]|nr:hypothetical protein [Deltaproteobacteria bacterium]